MSKQPRKRSRPTVDALAALRREVMAVKDAVGCGQRTSQPMTRERLIGMALDRITLAAHRTCLQQVDRKLLEEACRMLLDAQSVADVQRMLNASGTDVRRSALYRFADAFRWAYSSCQLGEPIEVALARRRRNGADPA